MTGTDHGHIMARIKEERTRIRAGATGDALYLSWMSLAARLFLLSRSAPGGPARGCAIVAVCVREGFLHVPPVALGQLSRAVPTGHVGTPRDEQSLRALLSQLKWPDDSRAARTMVPLRYSGIGAEGKSQTLVLPSDAIGRVAYWAMRIGCYYLWSVSRAWREAFDEALEERIRALVTAVKRPKTVHWGVIRDWGGRELLAIKLYVNKRSRRGDMARRDKVVAMVRMPRVCVLIEYSRGQSAAEGLRRHPVRLDFECRLCPYGGHADRALDTTRPHAREALSSYERWATFCDCIVGPMVGASSISPCTRWA